MKIINTNLKQEWFMISKTWQTILNNLLWEWLYYSFIRKKKEYFSKASKNYREKKKIKWAIWNIEKAKIFHQVNEFSEKSDDKLKFLKMRQEEMKKWIKATLF